MIGALVAGITGAGGASLSSYESIATVTSTGSETSLQFTSIPSGFKHLQIRGLQRSKTASTGLLSNGVMNINSDTGLNYTYHWLRGDGSTASATGGTPNDYITTTSAPRNNETANIFGALIIDILDYSSTTKNKTIRIFGGTDLNGSGQIGIYSALWINTNAVTDISLDISGDFVSASTFALYGIKEA